MIQKPYKKTKIYNKFLIPIVFSILLSSQVRAQDTDITSPGSFEFDQYDTPIVATVANVNISAKEFMLNYEFGPAFLKRSKDSKKRYLMVMIYEKLLALEGYKNGLDSNENVVRSVKAYTDDIMTEELFKEEVMSQVKVSNAEIDGAIPLEKIQVSLHWLYTTDKNEIFSLWNLLNSGASFDSLFSLQFNKEVSESDRTLNSSYFQLQQKNPQLAAIVNNLIPGEYSKPIHVDDGWYIVLLENILTNVLMTETEMIKVRQELERSIFKHKLDIASDRYIQELMNAQNPVIDQNAFSRVVYYLNNEFLYPDIYDPDLLRKLLPQNSNETNPDITKNSDQILVRSELYQIRLQDFVDWFRPRMAYLKYSSDSAENFILSVQQIIWRMVRDYLLVQRALKLSLDDRKGVKIQAEWWQDKILFNAMKSEIAKSITFTENDLRVYYNAHTDNYLDTNDKIIDFDRAKRNVRSDYIREKYMNKIMRNVLSLKQTYKIEIFDDLLENLNVEDEENPRTIDMFIVKKGGLLPRQPYPTIDWEWQQWY